MDRLHVLWSLYRPLLRNAPSSEYAAWIRSQFRRNTKRKDPRAISHLVNLGNQLLYEFIHTPEKHAALSPRVVPEPSTSSLSSMTFSPPSKRVIRGLVANRMYADPFLIVKPVSPAFQRYIRASVTDRENAYLYRNMRRESENYSLEDSFRRSLGDSSNLRASFALLDAEAHALTKLSFQSRKATPSSSMLKKYQSVRKFLYEKAKRENRIPPGQPSSGINRIVHRVK